MLSLLLAFFSAPEPLYSQSTVAVIELNHVHHESWEPSFDQLIFWEWRHCHDWQENETNWAHHVMCWRIVKPGEYTLRKEKGNWVVIFWEKDKGGRSLLRRVVAVSYRETYSNYDLEGSERQRLPQRFRRGI